MAKDVLLFTKSVLDATEEIIGVGGRVTHQFTDSVIVANLPEEVDPEKFVMSKTTRPELLDAISKLAADAWRASRARSMVLRENPKEGLSWGDPGHTPPHSIRQTSNKKKAINKSLKISQHPDESLEDTPEESTGTPTSRFMVGSIAVGVIIVSGPDDPEDNLAFTQAEREQVIAEVQEGLNFLANAEPRAEITFVYDIQHITVDVDSGNTSNYEDAEAPWRNAALHQMGFSGTREDSVRYVQTLQRDRRTRWAYVGYFTKYPLHHFAYTIDEKIVMNYANDGWGSDQINTVFAHETCHIFGAGDEYNSRDENNNEIKCSCGGSYGELGIPNNNCVNCATPQNPHVSCLMDANTLSLCQWTRQQIGWDKKLFPIPLAAGGPMGYVGGAPRVVYRGVDSRIHEFYLVDQWYHYDMNGISGAVRAAGDPMGYVGGAPRVVYRGVDNHIHEFCLTDQWNHYDMNGISGAVLAAGDPMGYVDMNGVPRVVYRGVDNRIHEFYLIDQWYHYDMNGISGAVRAAGDPMGYVGGAPRVVYRGVDNRIHEFCLTDQWNHYEMI